MRMQKCINAFYNVVQISQSYIAEAIARVGTSLLQPYWFLSETTFSLSSLLFPRSQDRSHDLCSWLRAEVRTWSKPASDIYCTTRKSGRRSHHIRCTLYRHSACRSFLCSRWWWRRRHNPCSIILRSSRWRWRCCPHYNACRFSLHNSGRKSLFCCICRRRNRHRQCNQWSLRHRFFTRWTNTKNAGFARICSD